METQETELEELLMRWETGALSVHEEEALAQRLLNDSAARRALVFAFMLSGEASRREAVRKAPSRLPVERWSLPWLVAGVGLAAATALVLTLGLGWPGPMPPQPAGSGLAGEKKEVQEPRGDGKEEPKSEEARIAELIKQLGDEEAAKREEADKALRALGAAAQAQLEKATSDADTERKTRATAILRVVRATALLKNLDAGLLAAAHVEGGVEYAMRPNARFQGTFRQAEGGKKFLVEVERAGDANAPKFKLQRTCLSDGATVWSKQTYETGGKSQPPTLCKVSLALLGVQGLAWKGVDNFQVSPVLLVKLVRGAAHFNSWKEGALDGQPVAILEGAIPADQRAMLTVGGAQAGTMMQSLTSPGPGPLAGKVRLYLSPDGALARQVEVLAEDHVVLWSVKLLHVKLGTPAGGAVFVFTPPEGAKVTDYDAHNKDGGDPNRR